MSLRARLTKIDFNSGKAVFQELVSIRSALVVVRVDLLPFLAIADSSATQQSASGKDGQFG